MTKRTFVVIPAYQAGKTIGEVFARLPRELQDGTCRIVVVNDGSSDDTGSIARAIAAGRDDTTVIEHESNRGYAQTQKTGFQHALARGADVVALLHADGQYPPEELPRLLEPLVRDEADLVQGSRMLAGGALRGGMPLYKFVANRALTTLENYAYGLDMAEYHSGYMLYARRTLEAIPFTRLSDTFHFDGEMILMAAKRGLRIVQLPIPTRYAGETSHLKPIRYGLDVLRIIWQNARGGYDF